MEVDLGGLVMRGTLLAVGLAVVLALGAVPASSASSPIRSFAPSNCHHTVFAHASGTQYGFTACTSSHRISLLVGTGSSWRRVTLPIYGTPLAAADNGKLTYLLYSTGGNQVFLAWVGRRAAGVSTYGLPTLGGTVFSGALVATPSKWRAMWSESASSKLWCAPDCYIDAVYRATSMSMAALNGRDVVAWVAAGKLYVGSVSSRNLTHRLLTNDRVGQPRLLSYRGHTAIAFPDYTTHTARLAVSQDGKWTFKTLGSLGAADPSLVSVGWGSNGSVVTWQTPHGLRVARYIHGAWHMSGLTGPANKALASSGTAALRSDGSVLLLGSHTSRVVG